MPTSSQGNKLPDGNLDPKELGPNNTPKRINPGPFSALVWGWVGTYVSLAFRQGQIREEDLPYVRTQSETAKLNERFVKELYYVDRDGKKVQRSLKWAIARTFMRPLLITGFLHVVELCAKLLTPLFINLILKWFEDDTATTEDGILYVVGLVGSTFFGQGLVWAHACMICYTMGMDVRTVCNSQVYRKAMLLSPSSRAKTSAGELVTFMSTDSEKLPMTMITIHNVWTAPAVIVGGIVLLYQYIGPATFVGVAVLILSIPAQGIIAVGVFKSQKAMAGLTDRRNNLVNEALQGIKILKLYGWEKSYRERIEGLRSEEMKYCATYIYRSAYMFFMFVCIPLLLNVGVFLTHWALGGDMGPSTVFTAMSLMMVIRFPMVMLPMTAQNVISAMISFKRMDDFFRLEEMSPIKNDCSNSDNAVELKGTFSWGAVPEAEPKEEKDASSQKEGDDAEGDVELAAINVEETVTPSPFSINIAEDAPLEVKKGELVAIVGMVGSGKSSLLEAALGELELKSGSLGLGSGLMIGYAAQTPWIVNNTLKNNVTMGLEFDQARFDHAIATCALASDIDMLPAGVNTEIGEKGINLSGGQKARVALARAVYFNPDIYMLDDPLSAVDAHVGKHLFEKAILKEMQEKGKTVLFATNQLHVLDRVDRIIVLKDGAIDEVGTYKKLMAANGAFTQLMNQFATLSSGDGKPGANRERVSSIASDDLPEKVEADQTEEGKLIKKEELETGGVDKRVFELYFVKAVGSQLVIVGLVMLSVIAQCTQNVHDLLTSVWTVEAGTGDFLFYFTIWAIMGVIALFLGLFRAQSWAWQAINASLNLHNGLLTNVLNCKMSFFDTTPLGRILNRFSKDFYMVDIELPRNVSNFVVCLTGVLGNFIFIGVVLPWFYVVLGPVLWYYYKVQRWYRPMSRDLQRIESASRSPIFASFSESVAGVVSVRAYGLSGALLAKSEQQLDSGNNAYYLMHNANRWLQVRLDALAGFVMTFICIFILLGKGDDSLVTLDAGGAGFMITYIQMVTGMMNWVVRMGCETEARITSVERVVEYAELSEVEAAAVVEDYRPPKEWPSEGSIEIKNLSMRYRPGLPLVLKDVNLSIPAGSHVGVAGRTGSGKSSLLVALFRLAEPEESSSVVIDGYECTRGGLADVRSAVGIIPQDPVMFQGTVRSNVDPVGAATDEEVLAALKKSQLGDAVSSLSDPVEDGGSNYSVGQRQLFCLARALLRRPKVLVLDEATANVDMQTDEKVQSLLRSEFSGCTVVTIAHRLNTIRDSDYVLVMDEGKVKEFDDPRKLEKDKKSMWAGLLKSESGN